MGQSLMSRAKDRKQACHTKLCSLFNFMQHIVLAMEHTSIFQNTVFFIRQFILTGPSQLVPRIRTKHSQVAFWASDPCPKEPSVICECVEPFKGLKEPYIKINIILRSLLKIKGKLHVLYINIFEYICVNAKNLYKEPDEKIQGYHISNTI